MMSVLRCAGFSLAGFLLFCAPVYVPAAMAEGEAVEARLARLEAKLAARGAESSLQELFTKINRLEQALRDVTGLAEDADRNARQLMRRFDKFAADAEDRLVLIEEKLRQGIVAPGDGPGDESGEVQGGQPGNAGALYDYALNRFLAKKDYPAAAKAFESFLDRFPAHEKADSIHYWLGELYYVQGNYKKAAQYYLDGYRAYEQGSKAMDNLFKLGLSLSALGQAEEACGVFDEMKTNFSGAPARITRLVERERRQIPCA